MRTLSKGTVYARRLRGSQTIAEGLVWQQLRGKRLEGIKFRRQQTIGNYIVDFVSYNKKLVIEIDGGQHNDEKDILYDNKRTKYLQSMGYVVLRFWNTDVTNNIQGVFEKILSVLPSL